MDKNKLRELIVIDEDGAEMEVVISTESVQKELDFENNPTHKLIDEGIFFYVQDDELSLPIEELAKVMESGLDGRTIIEPEL